MKLYVPLPRGARNRILPKSKIYAHAQPSRAVRKRFVEQVDEIVWSYVLGRKT